jgi:hypothetical protein
MPGPAVAVKGEHGLAAARVEERTDVRVEDLATARVEDRAGARAEDLARARVRMDALLADADSFPDASLRAPRRELARLGSVAELLGAMKPRGPATQSSRARCSQV